MTPLDITQRVNLVRPPPQHNPAVFCCTFGRVFGCARKAMIPKYYRITKTGEKAF